MMLVPAFTFIAVAAAMLASGINARRRPELGQNHRLWFAAAALFLFAAALFAVSFALSPSE